MPYPKKLLNDYESVALDLHPHWWFFSGPATALVASIVFGIVSMVSFDGDTQTTMRWAALVLIVLCALWLIVRYLKWTSTNFVITSDRVIFRQGVLSKHGIEIPLEDRLLGELGRRHPAYGFEAHKGYGTPEHWEALRRYGPCPEHRMTFRGVTPEAGSAPFGDRQAHRRGQSG